MNYFKKYLKYKNKYLAQKGGSDKKVVILGAGPVGLLTAISLLTQYRGNISRITIFERTPRWRHQVFFFQDSYTYETLSYIRHLDENINNSHKIYPQLEKKSCYTGSPASAKQPYCYTYDSKYKFKSNREDTPTENRDKVGYMQNLSFRIMDLLEILDGTLKYLISQESTIVVNYYSPEDLDEFNKLLASEGLNEYTVNDVKEWRKYPIGTIPIKFKVDSNGSILVTQKQPATTVEKEVLNHAEYDIAFACDSSNSQFADNDDKYYSLKNRKNLDLNNDDNWMLLKHIYDKRHTFLKDFDIIKIDRETEMYVVTASGKEKTDLTFKKIILDTGFDDKYHNKLTDYGFSVPDNSIYRYKIDESVSESDHTLIENKNIYKFNNLVFEEIEETPQRKREAISHANVMFYPFNENNLVLNNYFNNNDKYHFISTKGEKIISSFVDRINSDESSMIEKVYTNNDQVQYFNNEMGNLKKKDIETLLELFFKSEDVIKKIEKRIEVSKDEATSLKNQIDEIFNSPYIGPPSYSKVFQLFSILVENKKIKNNFEKLKKTFGLDAPTIHQKDNFNNPQHSFRVFGVREEAKHYYVGFQVSSELNKYFQINNVSENSKLKQLIFGILWLIGYLYSSTHETKIVSGDDNAKYNYYKSMLSGFTETYYSDDLDSRFLQFFDINLKYKENIAKVKNDKLIFFIGDSNTAVNFFSGTGVNNGIKNMIEVLNKLDDNNILSKESKSIKEFNNKMMVKNRVALYNSLLSTINTSYLNDNNYDGIAHSTIFPAFRTEEFNLPAISFAHSELLNFSKFYDKFYDHYTRDLEITSIPDRFLLKKILKLELINLISSIYQRNPILGGTDSNENVNYLSNMIDYYADFCKFNRKDLNKDKYKCPKIQTTNVEAPTHNLTT
tara:strand:- start:896 stop:3592 length:2697 start_codon:yes stop_codon:yes gene_type:complete